MPSSSRGAVWAQQQDPRVTPVGRLLRQYRLDELPQLFNVLKGEMNIVGPRPERPTIFAELREHIAEYPLRQRAKPGITGLAQINHHYDRSIDDVRTKVSYDLEYIRRQGLAEDLRIMLKTIPTSSSAAAAGEFRDDGTSGAGRPRHRPRRPDRPRARASTSTGSAIGDSRATRSSRCGTRSTRSSTIPGRCCICSTTSWCGRSCRSTSSGSG